MRKFMSLLLAGSVIATSLLGGVSASAKTVTVKEPFVVMKDGYRQISDSFTCSDFKHQSAGNKRVKFCKELKSSMGVISPLRGSEYVYPCVVKGTKTGTEKITIKCNGNTYNYTIKVVSKASVIKQSKAELKKYAKKLKNTKKCAYFDFNGDGVKELFHDGEFTYYNYATKAVVTKSSPVRKFEKLYVSKKNKLMYATVKQPAKDPVNKESVVEGRYIMMNKSKVFDIEYENIGYARYVNPKTYLPEGEYVEGENYYFIHDTGYDQDDYWYKPMTAKEKEDVFDKIMKDRVEIKFTEKPVIK